MNGNKTIFRFFTIAEWEQEQEFLRTQHKAGWRLSSVNFPGFYHFESCTPEDVVYQLDYNPDALKDKKAYLQLFQDCGWEYILDFVGYSYFRKPVSEMKHEEENIFCDEASRLDMIRRVLRNRALPLLVIFLCCVLPMLEESLSKAFAGFFAVILVVYTALFIHLGLAFWRLTHRN